MWKPTPKKVATLISQHYGAGFGADYVPWFRLRRGHFLPHSTHSINFCSISGRQIHVFSEIENFVNILARFCGATEVWEQKPIWPTPAPHPLAGHPDFRDFASELLFCSGTLSIAAEKGIAHPRYRNSEAWWVTTADVMAVWKKRSGAPLVASLHVKPSRVTEKELDLRPAELAELEHAGAKQMGMRFLAVDEKLCNQMTRENLKHFAPNGEAPPPTDGELLRLRDFCLPRIGRDSIADLHRQLRQKIGISEDEVAGHWRNLVWLQLIPVDIRAPRLHTRPAPLWDGKWIQEMRRVIWGPNL